MYWFFCSMNCRSSLVTFSSRIERFCMQNSQNQWIFERVPTFYSKKDNTFSSCRSPASEFMSCWQAKPRSLASYSSPGRTGGSVLCTVCRLTSASVKSPSPQTFTCVRVNNFQSPYLLMMRNRKKRATLFLLRKNCYAPLFLAVAESSLDHVLLGLPSTSYKLSAPYNQNSFTIEEQTSLLRMLILSIFTSSFRAIITSIGNFSSVHRYLSLLSSRMDSALWMRCDDFLMTIAPPLRLAQLSAQLTSCISSSRNKYATHSFHISSPTFQASSAMTISTSLQPCSASSPATSLSVGGVSQREVLLSSCGAGTYCRQIYFRPCGWT